MKFALNASLMLALTAGAAFADIEKIRSEQNLERRSEMALAHADEQFEEAKKAYDAGEIETFQSRLGEVVELAQLSYDSLQSTGKRARRSPKYWKRADQKLQALHRRLESMENSVAFDDRKTVEEARRKVDAVRDEIIKAIMSRK